ncbi:hypothetical protein POM88_039128 [Heracleum sosnowskyi]|uniref:Uncharacterized protein n=1 Tax=Heracleum sosnowskyi TaxID=360622 RepID=A0AAD8HCF8_9APIA|nr:hypothetical protein POM88_039128 [Heracleum sosnowskyi]
MSPVPIHFSLAAVPTATQPLLHSGGTVREALSLCAMLAAFDLRKKKGRATAAAATSTTTSGGAAMDSNSWIHHQYSQSSNQKNAMPFTNLIWERIPVHGSGRRS